jgi:hypothetical protein
MPTITVGVYLFKKQVSIDAFTAYIDNQEIFNQLKDNALQKKMI